MKTSTTTLTEDGVDLLHVPQVMRVESLVLVH